MSMKTKVCSRCNQNKVLSEFRFRNVALGILQTQCKTCCKIDGKKHYRKNRKEQVGKQVKRNKLREQWYHAFKCTLKCVYCPETFYSCMEFHHMDPSKKDMNPSRLATYPISSIARELRKCVCVCANCHRKIHAGVIEVRNTDLFKGL